MNNKPKRLNCTEKEYFKLMELKGKYGEKDLFRLLVKLDEMAQNNQIIHIVPVKPECTKIPTLDELIDAGTV